MTRLGLSARLIWAPAFRDRIAETFRSARNMQELWPEVPQTNGTPEPEGMARGDKLKRSSGSASVALRREKWTSRPGD